MKIFKILRTIFLIGIVAWAINNLRPHLNDFSKLWDLRNSVHYWWLGMAIFSQLFQYVGDGWLSQLLLRIINIHIKMKDTFRIAALNVFAAHLLPIGEAGGVAAAYHFYRKLGVTPENFIFTSICWGASTYILLFFLFVIPLFFLPNLKIPMGTQVITLTALVTALVFLAFWFRKPIFRKLQKLLGKQSWFKHVEDFVKNRHGYQKLVIEQPGLVFKSFLAGLIYYASNIATLVFSFLTFGEFPSIALATFAYSVSLLLGRLTLAPAGIGATEATLILMFLSAGIDGNKVITAVLLYRFISFWLPIPGGAFSYYSLRKELGEKVVNKDIEKALHLG